MGLSYFSGDRWNMASQDRNGTDLSSFELVMTRVSTRTLGQIIHRLLSRIFFSRSLTKDR